MQNIRALVAHYTRNVIRDDFSLFMKTTKKYLIHSFIWITHKAFVDLLQLETELAFLVSVGQAV